MGDEGGELELDIGVCVEWRGAGGEMNGWWRRQQVRQRGQGLLEAGGVRSGFGVWFVAWMKQMREEIGEVVVCDKRRGEGG